MQLFFFLCPNWFDKHFSLFYFVKNDITVIITHQTFSHQTFLCCFKQIIGCKIFIFNNMNIRNKPKNLVEEVVLVWLVEPDLKQLAVCIYHFIFVKKIYSLIFRSLNSFEISISEFIFKLHAVEALMWF